ncbi:MAG: IclR family transcriptional regulator [Acidimicrobiia bacterium]|nr:IclR family transcriptional regulator [Acidimicrobiia bacterium]
MQSIERAFVVMRALAVGPAGVTELAERCDLPKSTVARILNALEDQDAVEQDETGGDYRLGPSLADLAGAAAPGRNLITAARPHLWDLTEATSETSGLSVIDRDSVLYLDHYESSEEVLVRSWTGERVPLHLVPSGLVMLADQPEEFLASYLAKPLASTTAKSVTDPAAIRLRLREIQATGFAWGFAEFDESINSVAAPITDHTGATIAALHIHGPAYRFPERSQVAEIAEIVRLSADRLSQQLTY